MAGEHLDAVGQLHQPPQRVKEPFRALGRADREVGARGVADEERVAGEHEPGLVRAQPVDHREATVLGPVAGRVDAAHRDVADHDLRAVLERVVGVLDHRPRMDGHRDVVLERETAVPRDVVGMGVGLDRPHDPDVEPVRLREHVLDRVRRVDDDRLARLLAADEVRGATEVAVQDLREEHRPTTVATDAAIALEVGGAGGGAGRAGCRESRRSRRRRRATRDRGVATARRLRPRGGR